MTDIIDRPELYEQLEAMTEEDRVKTLDPICDAVRGKAKLPGGSEVLSNRIFALAVIDLYSRWQREVYNT